MQCPVDFVAVKTVCMQGSVIGAGCAVRPKQLDDWTEVPNLWGGVVARPGMLKSPAISEGLGPLRVLERTANQLHQSLMAGYQQQKLKNKLRSDMAKKNLSRKKIDKDINESDDFLKLCELSNFTAEEPKLRRYQTNDSTVEKLGESLAANQRGILVNRDELVGLLQSLEKQGHDGDRAFYLEGWNGKAPYRTDRIGRGEIFIPHHCISVFGGIQPAKLLEYLLATRVSGNDGFIQRFQLLVFPDGIENPQLVDQAPDQLAKTNLINIVELLADIDFATRGAMQDQDGEIPYFRFDAIKAQPLFFKWLSKLDLKVAEEEDAIIAEHLSKFRKLVPSLSLIFHLFEHISAGTKTIPSISIKNLKMAIAWADYLLTHARRIYAMGNDFGLSAAESLSKKIRKGEVRSGFDERKIYRAGWANLGDKESVSAACKELEAAGWIRKRKLPRVPGRQKSPTYDINPNLPK